MFSALRKVPRACSKVVKSPALSRNFYHMVGRPREPVSLAEIFVHGAFIGLGIFSIPVWVLVHIKDYRGLTKQEE